MVPFPATVGGVAVLLLTGSTGMVGREILARAVAEQRYDEILCVIRPGSSGADDRLTDLMHRSGVTGRNVRAVAGDVTEPGLGVQAADRRRITNIIHGAASVAFDLPPAEARRINVGGTRNVLDLCSGLPQLERLDAVSTCYVAGRRQGLVYEKDLGHACGFHNTYELSKYEAEGVLRSRMRDLPIAVHRPSIVVGDSRTGATGAWKVVYWPLKVIARGRLPVIPYDPDCRLDIVPVDFVASAILALAADAGTVGGTFHLAAGPGRDTTTGELFPQIFRALDRRPPVRVPPAVFRRFVRPALQAVPSSRMRRTLRAGLVYRPYLELRVRFDTAQADAALAGTGVTCPRVVDYMDTIVRAALESDFGARG